MLLMEAPRRSSSAPPGIWGAANKEFCIAKPPGLQKYALYFFKVLWFPVVFFVVCTFSSFSQKNTGKNYDQKALEFLVCSQKPSSNKPIKNYKGNPGGNDLQRISGVILKYSQTFTRVLCNRLCCSSNARLGPKKSDAEKSTD